MSRRVPVSAATREYDRLVDRWRRIAPDILECTTVGDIRPFEICRHTMDTAGYTPMDIVQAMNDSNVLSARDVVWMARWRRCRHVFRVDRDVTECLLGQELDGSLPVEALSRIPYPIIFVESRFVIDGGDSPIEGFFAWTDADEGGSPVLCIVYLLPNGVKVPLTISLAKDTVEDVVDGVLAEAVETAKSSGIDGFFDAGSYRDWTESNMRQAVNILCYIVSSDDDPEIVYRPPSGGKGQRAGRRSNLETHHIVGARMGRAIGAARTVASGSRGDGSRTVSPHVRRAHWQHFWTGKRRGRDDGRFGDELVVRWIPPVFVNGDGEAVEVVHEG